MSAFERDDESRVLQATLFRKDDESRVLQVTCRSLLLLLSASKARVSAAYTKSCNKDEHNFIEVFQVSSRRNSPAHVGKCSPGNQHSSFKSVEIAVTLHAYRPFVQYILDLS